MEKIRWKLIIKLQGVRRANSLQHID